MFRKCVNLPKYGSRKWQKITFSEDNPKIRYSLSNLKNDGRIVNIPLFLADWTGQLLKKTK